MARINDRLLVQRVDDQLVLLDESAGAEVTVSSEDVVRVVDAIAYLFQDEFNLTPKEPS